MEARSNTKRILLSALVGLGGAVGLFVSPVLYFLPALLCFVYVCWGRACAAVAFGVAGLCVGLLAGAEAWYVLGVFLPAALLLGICCKLRRPYRSAVFGLIVCFALARYAALCLPALLAGENPFYDMRTLMAQMTELYASTAETLGYPLPAALTALVVDMTPQITIAVILAPAMFYALANVLLAYALCVKNGAQLTPMAALRDWQLSRDALVGAGILAAGAIAVNLLSLTYAGAITMAIEILLFGEFALNGFCYSEFTAHLRAQGVGRRILRYALYLLFLPYSAILLAILGLMECALQLRRRYNAAQKPGPPEA